jgi:hypothetical protein
LDFSWISASRFFLCSSGDPIHGSARQLPGLRV